MIEMMSDKIIYLFTNAFALYTLYCFLKYFLENKSIYGQYLFAIYAASFVFITTMYFLYESILVNMLVKLICIFLLTLFCKRDIFRKILAVVLFYVLAMISEIGISFLFTMIKGMQFSILYQDNNFKLLMLTCSQLILFMIIKLISCIRRKHNGVELPLLYWLAILTIPSGSIFILHVIFSYNKIHYHIEFNALNISAIIVVIGINCLIFYLYDKLLLDTAIQTQNTLLEQQIKYYIKQYEETKNMQIEVSSIRHDIRNQLLGIQGYFKDKDYNGLIKHIENLLGEIERTKGLSYSGNAVIDSILYHKIACAKKADISIVLDLTIPSSIQVDSNNICIILGNALDNAIEACCSLAKEERKIFIMMRYERFSLYINIVNPYEGELKFDLHGDLISSKKENKNHGIGTRNMRRITEREGYFMKIDSADHIFKLQIIFFEKQ